MHDVQQLHDRSAVVGDGDVPALIDQFIHSTGSKRGADGVHDGHAGIDVANELGLALRCIGSLLEDDDARLLHYSNGN